MNLLALDRRGWVIFDTCQYQNYYRDVHDVLACPAGTIRRYEYRRDLLSDDAVHLSTKRQRREVLLVYAQKRCAYTRCNSKADITDEQAEIDYVATRLASMLNVVVDGDRYYFDFALAEYPNQDATEFKEILAPLLSRGEVPWSKWVSTCIDGRKIRRLREAENGKCWTSVVNRLAAPPMQFCGDAFWRVAGPYDRKGRVLPTKTEWMRHDGQVRQAKSYFVMPESRTWHFELTSVTPYDPPGSRPDFEVKAASTDSTAVAIIGSGRYALRHYTAQQVEYRSEARLALLAAHVDVTLATEPSGPWPSGPAIELRHRVSKGGVRIFLGLLCGFIGLAALGFAMSKLAEQSPKAQVVGYIAGPLLLVAGVYLLSGKIEFKS